MRLHNLVKSEGESHPTKRLGRGRSSGHGKTSGRGHKGQHARAGSSIRPGFESGHVPLYRKLPKRGFNRARFQTEWSIANIGSLEAVPAEVTEITPQILADCGIIRFNSNLVKVLGEGEISRAVTVFAHKFSASAKEKIEKAGGKAVELSDASAQSEEAQGE
ncbi:MAG: 50S ribosomal protein L15 [Opitutales bacterium]|nr:50S ribosomal protein L15 [Opitutales bacterium]